ncbi:MAG: homoserine O-acetyltransferase [Actinobacteria bacterium]|nr:homoserine O-acetyltransferase [Actinomycetota bacterium]MBS1900239.1 homoserine O-acetyltransferase [Actinomycetota bacterium]
MSPAVPVTGAWRAGDPPGHRQFATLFAARPHILEAGGRLGPVGVAYETWGELDATRGNAVLLLHALTGDSHATGPAGHGHPADGWWDPLVGPGRAIDTDRFFVVCPNVLGGCQGTTGPATTDPETGRPFGSRFPMVTIRDQVVVEAALADRLGIARWAAVIGGSMGGQRALEWAVSFPARVPRAVILACGAQATAEEIALCSLQIRAIRSDPRFRGGDYYDAAAGDGPWRGMSLARGIGQVSYRSEPDLDQRFGRGHQGDEQPLDGGRYAIESYLDYHGEKLAWRFDANTYVRLSQAMNHHDVGRGRGGIATALSRITADVTLAGITSDRLYPLRLQEELAELIPGAAKVAVIESPDGHDGFLTETEQVAAVLRPALDRA